MLDATVAEAADRSPVAAAGLTGSRRRRIGLAGCVVLVLSLHGACLGGVTGRAPEVGDAASAASPVSIRTVAVESASPSVPEVTRAPEATVEAAEAMPDQALAVPAPLHAKPRESPRSQKPMPTREGPSVWSSATVGARFVPVATAEPAAATSGFAAPPPVELAGANAAPAAASVTTAPAAGPATTPFLTAGEPPPPVYRTRLPPPATLRYEVRRGVLRGTGEIRWRPAGDAYRLVLEARIAGLTLLVQTSEGAIDPTGLAPVRLVDQRARRSAQAANFSRDSGKVTFSGSATERPLLPGTQDRLSWMIQLAGIVAAAPELLVDGSQIAMVVVGARGEAEVWSLRYAGRESVDTVRSTVHAVKFVRDGRSAYDTHAEIWLDPERDYFPVHATLHNSAGGSEYELLLERIEAAP